MERDVPTTSTRDGFDRIDPNKLQAQLNGGNPPDNPINPTDGFVARVSSNPFFTAASPLISIFEK